MGRGEGVRAVWDCSENLTVLVLPGLPNRVTLEAFLLSENAKTFPVDLYQRTITIGAPVGANNHWL